MMAIIKTMNENEDIRLQESHVDRLPRSALTWLSSYVKTGSISLLMSDSCACEIVAEKVSNNSENINK